MMQNKNQKVKISLLLEQLIYAAIDSCKIIKDFYEKQNFQKYEKMPGDYVTNADFKIQTMIIKRLQKQYPEIKIVGEQVQDYSGQIQENNLFPKNQAIKEAIAIDHQVQKDTLCIWIDPIDSTSSFIKGQNRMQNVTVIIGVSQNQEANLGVIAKPYKVVNGKLQYNPQIIFGSVQGNLAYQYSLLDNYLQKIKAKEPEASLKAVTGIHDQPQLRTIIKVNMKAETIKVGGVGHRSVLCIKGEVDFILLERNYGSRWDICGCQAIIKAVGGRVSDLYGNTITYEMKKEHVYDNNEGFIGAINSAIFSDLLESTKIYFKKN